MLYKKWMGRSTKDVIGGTIKKHESLEALQMINGVDGPIIKL